MPPRTHDGFSLMEILIAMFLLAICIGLLAGTYPLLKASSRQADHLAMASLMAQAVMERKLAGLRPVAGFGRTHRRGTPRVQPQVQRGTVAGESAPSDPAGRNPQGGAGGL